MSVYFSAGFRSVASERKVSKNTNDHKIRHTLPTAHSFKYYYLYANPYDETIESAFAKANPDNAHL